MTSLSRNPESKRPASSEINELRAAWRLLLYPVMRSFPLTVAVLSSLLPGAALACGAGYEVLGSAAFTPAGEITALSAGSNDFRWLNVAKDERDLRGRLAVEPYPDALGPRIRATDDRLFAMVSGTLHEVGAPASLDGPQAGYVSSFDVARAGAFLLAATFHDAQGLPQLALYDLGKGALRELARADASSCEMHLLAVGRLSDGSIAGLCGDTPFRLDGDTLSFEAPLGLGALHVVESAGIDTDGSATFFAVRNATGETTRSNVVSVRRSLEGAWSVEVVAILPISYTGEGRLAAAGPDAVAVAGVDDAGSFNLYAIRRTGDEDLVEIVATIGSDDRLSAQGDAASMQILAGGYRLSLFENTESNVWTETSLGRIGKRVEFAGCSLAGAPASGPSASLALLALASVAAVVISRRRS